MAKRKGNPAFMKELNCSEELADFLGTKTISRPQMMKKVWAHIKRHKLQDKKQRRVIIPDEKLGAVLGSKPLDMFKMTKKLMSHLEA